MKEKKRLLKIIVLIVATACSVALIPWVVVRAWLTPLSNTVQKEVESALDYGLDGIVVYVDKGGKPPQLHASGWKDKAKNVPADPNALFKIGSISKLYLAAASAKVVAGGILSLSDTLDDLLPELAERIENSERITLKMLLQHRSGIPDWIEDPEFPWDKSLTDINDVLELVLNDPPDFEPDSRYDYSNTNYLLIGLILDKALGYDHQEFIKSEILAPLRLTHTYGSLGDVDPDLVISGYDAHYDSDVKMLDFVSPGGSMIATARDVGVFLRALNDGSLLNNKEQDIYSSTYAYEHTGLLPGYQSIARYHKGIDAVVVQFVNSSGGNRWTVSEVLYDRIVKILQKDKHGDLGY